MRRTIHRSTRNGTSRAVLRARLEHSAVEFVFGLGPFPLPPGLLLVQDPLGFLNQLEGHRDAEVSHPIERAQQIYAFDVSPFAMVIVPADELALVGVGLLFDG